MTKERSWYTTKYSMIIKTVKTDKIRLNSHTINNVIDASVSSLQEKSILVVTSKIISLCEGRAVKIGDAEKSDLVIQESQQYLPPELSPQRITLTIANNLLVPTAGIDESNGNGYYVLWPENPQQSAREIREYVTEKFQLQHVGVIITDSRTTPMRWGTSGVALSYAGFSGLNDFIGSPDLFGRNMEVTMVNVADGLAAAAVVCMGESNEQTPIAIITDTPFVTFDAQKPTDKELEVWKIPVDIDLYGPILSRAPWKKGEK